MKNKCSAYTPCVGESSPKIPKLSPKIFKKEKLEFELLPPEETTPRRITRQALHDNARKSTHETEVNKPIKLDNKTAQPIKTETEKPVEASPVKKPKKRKISELEKLTGVVVMETEDQESHVNNTPSEGLSSRRADPPPPLLIPSVPSSQFGGQESTSSSNETDPPVLRENTVQSVLSWQLIPESVAETIKVTPSMVYGAQHLLRLFGKFVKSAYVSK